MKPYRPRLTSKILTKSLRKLDTHQRKNVLLDANRLAVWVPGVGRWGALEILARIGEMLHKKKL